MATKPVAQHDNGQLHAFPHLHIEGGIVKVRGGLSKREYFAAMAMQGFCASTEGGFSSSNLAESSVRCADALISALLPEGTHDAGK